MMLETGAVKVFPLEPAFMNGLGEIVGISNMRDVLSNLPKNFGHSRQDLMPTVVFISNILSGHLVLAVEKGSWSGSGRAFGKYFLKEYCEVLGFDTHEFNLLSGKQRLSIGMKKIADFFSHEYSWKIHFRQDDSGWYWDSDSQCNIDSDITSEGTCNF